MLPPPNEYRILTIQFINNKTAIITKEQNIAVIIPIAKGKLKKFPNFNVETDTREYVCSSLSNKLATFSYAL